MLRRLSRIPPMLLATALAACQDSTSSPTEAAVLQGVPPPAGSDLVFTAAGWAPGATAFTPREIFAVDASGSGLTRLTFCNAGGSCDYADVAPSASPGRVMARRLRGATAEIAFLDLARGVEAVVVPSTSSPTGIDWPRAGGVIVYSGGRSGPAVPSGSDDLFRAEQNGTGVQGLTDTGEVSESRPRLDAAARILVYERRAAGDRSVAVLFAGALQQFTLTSGAAGAALPDGSYRIGSDADPAFSPDARFVVLRRLRAAGTDGRGQWDIVVVSAMDSAVPERVIASGPAFRGAPDWGPAGIVFAENEPGSATTRLVIVQPDGSGRQVPVTLQGRISSPRWLPETAG
jgi:hypothetical protein